jgi:hypothetical protein
MPGWPNKKRVGARESTKISKMFAAYEFFIGATGALWHIDSGDTRVE